MTAYIDGVHGDCSATFYVGEVDSESRGSGRGDPRSAATSGSKRCGPGRPISDIGRAIEAHATGPPATEWCGCSSATGSASSSTSRPSVPHYYMPDGVHRSCEPGMTFTIEPMITIGTWREKMWDNGWTAVTADGKRTAQFEHTVLVTHDRGRDPHSGAR